MGIRAFVILDGNKRKTTIYLNNTAKHSKKLVNNKIFKSEFSGIFKL